MNAAWHVVSQRCVWRRVMDDPELQELLSCLSDLECESSALELGLDMPVIEGDCDTNIAAGATNATSVAEMTIVEAACAPAAGKSESVLCVCVCVMCGL